jgi:hypothetical protein
MPCIIGSADHADAVHAEHLIKRNLLRFMTTVRHTTTVIFVVRQAAVNPALAIQIAVSFLWLGLVLGISFLEAPIKFRAPGVTIEIGVGIGRLVFRTLNVIEGVLAIVLIVAVAAQGAGMNAVALALAIALIVVLAAGALVLRPLMDRRVREGRTADRMPRHSMHYFYVGLEVIKVALLVWMGVLGLSLA